MAYESRPAYLKLSNLVIATAKISNLDQKLVIPFNKQILVTNLVIPEKKFNSISSTEILK